MKPRQDIEFFRVISAFAIVWYHSGVVNGHEVSLGGLFIFLMLSMYLAGRGSLFSKHNIYLRVKRILTPWAFWFIVYAVINLICDNPMIPIENGIIAAVLSGPSIHLWYMPFIFVCLVIFDVLRKYFSRVLIAKVSAILAVIVICSADFWRVESLKLGPPLAQYTHALPGVFFGIYFSQFDAISTRIKTLLLILMATSAVYVIPFEGLGVPYLIGVAVGGIVAFRVYEKVSLIDFRFISQLTLGIFMVHILFLGALKKIGINGMILPILTFILSSFFIYFLRALFPKLSKYCS